MLSKFVLVMITVELQVADVSSRSEVKGAERGDVFWILFHEKQEVFFFEYLELQLRNRYLQYIVELGLLLLRNGNRQLLVEFVQEVYRFKL